MQLVTRPQALIATVAYADIFDYPLTRKELVTWSLFYPTKRQILPNTIHTQENYAYFSHRTYIVEARKKKLAWQERKWQIAKTASVLLSYISTIKFIGVTGGLAMNNAKKEDDVDLFFI